VKVQPLFVYVVDAWDDDARESCVRVFSTRRRPRGRREVGEEARGHDLYAGIVKRKVL